MKICLKNLANRDKLHSLDVILTDRLPDYIKDKCHLTCQYYVTKGDNYYLLSLKVSGLVQIICQRCNEIFHHNYDNETVLAVCDNDIIANAKMSEYECIVENSGFINLTEIITDELYLFMPDKHSINYCPKEFIEEYLN